MSDKLDTGCLLSFLLLISIGFGGWMTHIIVCIQDEKWLLLIAGAIAAPIGVIHGVGTWFGVF